MKKLGPVRSPLVGFLLGVLFCAVGMCIILYIGWSYLKSDSEEKQQNTDIANEQPSQGEAMPPLTDADGNIVPQDSGQLSDSKNKPTPEGITGDDGSSAPIYSDGKLGETQGAGGMSHLKKVAGQYTNKEEFVHKNVHTSLMNMIFAAKQDGISLTLVSAFRSYSHQKRIWENKWGNTPNTDTAKAKNILRYSSFPGTSRHHWGTDVDFNSVSSAFWKTGEGKRIHSWLVRNGPQFGFCEIYAPGRGKGYSDEPWHWTHAPTANRYYSQMSNPQVLNIALSQDIKGAAAVRKMPNEMMDYITGVSGCNVSSAPQQANYPTEAQAPRSGKKPPLHEETPLNNPNLRASLSPYANSSNNLPHLNNPNNDSQNNINTDTITSEDIRSERMGDTNTLTNSPKEKPLNNKDYSQQGNKVASVEWVDKSKNNKN